MIRVTIERVERLGDSGGASLRLHEVTLDLTDDRDVVDAYRAASGDVVVDLEHFRTDGVVAQIQRQERA